MLCFKFYFEMKKTRLVFYWFILVLLVFLYYVIIDALYADIGTDISERQLVPQLVASINLPMIIVLGLVRLWLLKLLSQRSRILDVPYFVLPVLIIIASFAEQLWAGIILSALAGGLIAYEFIRSIIKKDSLSLREG